MSQRRSNVPRRQPAPPHHDMDSETDVPEVVESPPVLSAQPRRLPEWDSSVRRRPFTTEDAALPPSFNEDEDLARAMALSVEEASGTSVSGISEESIVQFCSVTEAAPNVATQYLQAADGNVDMAIMLFLESGGSADTAVQTSTATALPTTSVPPPARTSVSSSSNSNWSDAGRNWQDVRAPIAPRRSVLNAASDDEDEEMEDEDLQSASRYPAPSRPARTNLQDAFREFATSRPPERQLGAGLALPVDPTSRLAELFRPPFDLMTVSGFDNALGFAQRSKKWLMVNLQDPHEFVCQCLNRDIWRNDSVKEMVRSSFVFLQLGSETAEGKRYSTFYPVEGFPHVALIDPRTGERAEVVHVLSSPSEFVQHLMDFLERHSLTNNKQSLPVEKQRKRPVEMTEEEQLEVALAASMESVTPSSSVGAAQPIILNDDILVEEAEEEPLSSAMKAIKTLPAKENVEPSASDSYCTRVQFRMRDGSRVVRRFRTSEPVSALFSYAKFLDKELALQPFELQMHKDLLSARLYDSLSDAGVSNASLTISLI